MYELNAASRLMVTAEIDYYKGIKSYVDDAMDGGITASALEKLVYTKAGLKVPELKPLDDWLKANKKHWTALEDAVGEGSHVVKGVTVPAAVYASFAKLYNAMF